MPKWMGARYTWVEAVPQQYRERGYHFGNWYSAYDWNDDDGYNNFASWVG